VWGRKRYDSSKCVIFMSCVCGVCGVCDVCGVCACQGNHCFAHSRVCWGEELSPQFFILMSCAYCVCCVCCVCDVCGVCGVYDVCVRHVLGPCLQKSLLFPGHSTLQHTHCNTHYHTHCNTHTAIHTTTHTITHTLQHALPHTATHTSQHTLPKKFLGT